LKRFLTVLFFLSLFFSAKLLYPQSLINVWRHSEIAGKNSVFLDMAAAPFLIDDFQFNFLPVELRIEYFPPLPLPVAVGFFMRTPYPNLKNFGLRASYHFDLFDRYTDFYVAYSYDFGWLRNDLLAEYNDTPVENVFYDFRIGVRRFFGPLFGVSLETGFHFESVIIMLSIKIN